MPTVSLSDWNQFLLRHPGTHLLQTGPWGELKSGFGWQPARVLTGTAGVQILFRRLPLGVTIGYIPKAGPAVQPSAQTRDLWQEIDRVCREHRAIFLKWEPDLWESANGSMELSIQAGEFRRSPHNIQPPRTLVVPIDAPEEELLQRMKQKTRYNIRLAQKKGVTVRTWSEIESFHRMMLITGDRDGFGVHSLEYYRRAYDLLHPAGMGELLLAEYEGRPLAALFVARHGHRAYYLYGASTEQERSRMPAYLLQWEAMQWARSHGCEEYDLWGVPDEEEAVLEAGFESRREDLWGVYRFKRGFGGTLKRAAQALDRVYNPLLYQAYLRFFRNRM